MSTLSESPTAALGPAEPARRVPWWVEALGLLLAPGVVALVLRFGQVPPASGDVGLRYVLALVATVPAYLWLRRRSLAAGALAVAVVLSSPVVHTAWDSDRSDRMALAFLLAGLPLLGFWTTGVRRLLMRGLAGVFLGLAAHAEPTAAPLVVGALVALAASAYSRHTGIRRARVRRVSVELVAVIGGLVLTTLLLDGRPDTLAPAFDQVRYPKDGRPWSPSATSLLVPPAVVLAWAWLCRRRRWLLGEWPRRGDAVVVLGSGLGYLAFLAVRAADGSTSMDAFALSLLWAGTCLTTALLLSTLSSSWWPVAAVLGLGALQVRIGALRFELLPGGLALALVVVVAAAVMGSPRRRSMPMLVVTIGLALLTTG
ncbi:hypothetical protein [Actinomycetospora sp. NBRC 106378]|uniref:hypothetical protein n=1 Tax=Actinomycetospora sp. NBRC 106378 TaxID=3032208 RepID=UPI0024A5ABAD|nr:hypothetical protein [Actinomycetospora sp. NBRC 106378]GLZ51528.1 hypothetical protein Acsp07_11450 [Actinomycetospora sp. NBRC 106378]